MKQKPHQNPNSHIFTAPRFNELPDSFGKIPDIRHPDTIILDWMERRWSDEEDCPIAWDGESFVPVCESGVWPPDMTLRQAIQKAMKIEQDREGE